jgi:flagellar motor switch protein FliN
MNEQGVLTPDDSERLRRLAQEAITPGMGALSTFLDKMLTLREVTCQTISLVQLKREFSASCLSIETGNGLAVEEWFRLLLKQDSMNVLVSLLIGEEGAAQREAFSDMELSILEESLTQVTTPIAAHFTKLCGGRAAFSPPRMEMLVQGILTTDFSEKLAVDRLVVVAYLVQATPEKSFRLYLVLPLPMAQKLLNVKPGVDKMERKKDAGSDFGIGRGESAVQPVEFPNVTESDMPRIVGEKSSIDLIKDVALDISVELGRTKLPIREVLSLTTGSVVILDKAAGGSVDLLVNNKLYARGEVVVIDENFGVRVTDILTPEERISNLEK